MLGSKYENLVKLKENGFNVANFEVIQFEDVINNPNEIIQIIQNNKNKTNKEISNLLKRYIENNIIQNFSINLQCDKYAVRSSSNIEDGINDSFAGQFDTYLNVKKEDLNTNIIKCFKSLYNENVLDYVFKKKIDISDLKMNVIIQGMVQSEYSGIIFTANPQGILNESVIVVGKGLGEKVVSDKIKTTSYFYNINDKLYYYEGLNDYLNKNQVDELIDISQNITNILGKYLDIEFGIYNNEIFILQARHITTIDDSNPLILDNSNIVESYPGISLPLTISFVNSIYSGVFEGVSRRILKNERELTKHSDVFKNMVGSANGRIYYKISNWYTVIKFLPFSKKIIPIWQEMLGVKNKKYDDEKVKLSFITRVRVYINSFYELARTPKNMERLNKKFITINDEFYKKFNSTLDEKEVMDLYNKVGKELFSCWDVTLLNDTYTFIFTGLLKNRLKKKYKNFEEIANNYISGITNIESMKPIKELITLAYKKDEYSREEYDVIIAKYIQKYGDRNLEELKLESQTFRANPELLIQKIQEYREDMDKLKEIYININSNDYNYDIKENWLTKILIKKCTLGIKNREISRLNRSRIFGMVRSMILRWGEIYEEQGLIEDKRDIFYLTLEEIENMILNKESKVDVIIKRKEDYKLYECLPAFTRIIFTEKEFNKHHTNVNMNRFYSNMDELRGIPCSNGKVRGKALVITEIKDVKDVKDKILITKMTDPGWVFLLATAKGIISEKGSLLSHTAIISRELKIPSIVGVNNLLNTIKSGDIIEMDGNTGIINIIKKSETEERSESDELYTV